jgi:hypothetical protein
MVYQEDVIKIALHLVVYLLPMVILRRAHEWQGRSLAALRKRFFFISCAQQGHTEH